jgi:hypothetical protein
MLISGLLAAGIGLSALQQPELSLFLDLVLGLPASSESLFNKFGFFLENKIKEYVW